MSSSPLNKKLLSKKENLTKQININHWLPKVSRPKISQN